MIYALSKIFTAFFLPPGLFVVILAISAYYAKRWRPLFAIFASLFYLLSIEPVADALLEPFESPYRSTLLAHETDALVMLGGGKVQGSPNLPLKDEAFKRAVYALTLGKRLDRPIIVSGGARHNYTEGQAFRDSLQDLRPILASVPERIEKFERRFAVLFEEKSMDTYQNVFYVKQLLPDHAKVIVVTSAYHMRRAMMLFKHFGIEATPAATDFHVSKTPYDLYDLLPRMASLHNSYRALHETFGILKLKMREMLQ